MELYVLSDRRGEAPLAVVLPDDWVEDVQQKLQGTRFQGLVSRLDPYGSASYGGADLGLLREALELYATRSPRHLAVTRQVQGALEVARQEQRVACFAGD